MKDIFVTGIGTGVGKTLVSAVLAEMLGTQAGYWKPLQCGDLDFSDTDRVRSLVTRPDIRFFPETYRLSTPASPHQAARKEGISLHPDHFVRPVHPGPLIIEGAGGVMVPLNEDHTMLDLVKKFQAPCLLVSQIYLGSINHTLLTWNELRRNGVEVLGLIFNGEENQDTENLLLRKTHLPCLGVLRPEPEISPGVVSRYAGEWRQRWIF